MTNKRPTDQVANESGLLPLGRAVLLKAYEPEFAKTTIEIALNARERSMMNETRAVIVAVGPEAWKDEKAPRAYVGDKVLVSRYCGSILVGPADGEVYRMVNERDIYARIAKEAKAENIETEKDAKTKELFVAMRKEKRNLDEEDAA